MASPAALRSPPSRERPLAWQLQDPVDTGRGSDPKDEEDCGQDPLQ